MVLLLYCKYKLNIEINIGVSSLCQMCWRGKRPMVKGRALQKVVLSPGELYQLCEMSVKTAQMFIFLVFLQSAFLADFVSVYKKVKIQSSESGVYKPHQTLHFHLNLTLSQCYSKDLRFCKPKHGNKTSSCSGDCQGNTSHGAAVWVGVCSFRVLKEVQGSERH
ncbi:hypothetical protein IHE44_0001484 [Lamprotornis superbus]|uniref:Uncharacterized protein n=1 Tax=Lamprotornis superbus TaxID=245042 RepID=A0A835NSC4_9PASS|nr:hypothetical protein IHE44_0001484 [Lamprotornis superbus]